MKNQGDNLKFYLRKTAAMVGFIALCATFCVAQTFEQLKSFGSGSQLSPKKLFEGADGAFYGLNFERILKLSKDGVEVNALFRLTNGGPAGVQLMDLIEGQNDKLYGVTSSGGRLGGGTVFSLGKDGTGLSIVHDFDLSQSGQWLFKLLAGNDGFLLGLTGYISSSNKATIFRLRTDGSGYSVLRTFGDSPGDPADPRDLIRGTDGLIYGVSAGGGAAEFGTLFRLNADGSAFTVLLDFEGGARGHTPALVIEGADGILYGTSFLTTESGEHGAVFRVSKSGEDFHITSTYTITGEFDFQTGLILEGRDGALYGTTNWRNHRSEGGLFRINKDGSGFTVLHSVARGVFQTITRAKDGFIYGTTSGGGAAGGGTLFQLKPDAAEFNVLRDFDTPSSDGVEPISLVLGHDGVLYGAAYEGGEPGIGTIFRVNLDGSAFRVLRRFSETNEGAYGTFALADGKDGYLYGSTLVGGALGGGTFYKLKTDGSQLIVLRSLPSPEPDYSAFLSDLILATDGALYGILGRDGAASAGSLFKINRDGSGFTNLQQFETSLSNSLANPYGLTEGSDGRLYGSTFGGGPNNPGVIYSLSKDGSNFTVLHHFDASRNGWAFGGGPLISAAEGTLFGARSGGGAFDGGMVFRLNKDGSGFTVLRSFPVRSDYPINPRDLALGKDGCVYGVTTFGGDFDAGILFRMRPDGSDFVIVHHFGRNEDRFDFNVPVPNRIVSSANGTIYGITARGGEYASGSIYRLLMPDYLRPRLGIFQDLDPAFRLIELRGVADQNYQIEWSEDLHVWTEVFTLRTSTNGITGKTVPRTSPQQFFRAVQR